MPLDLNVDLAGLINATGLQALRGDERRSKAQIGATVPKMMRMLQDGNYDGLDRYFTALGEYSTKSGETPLPDTLAAWAPIRAELRQRRAITAAQPAMRGLYQTDVPGTSGTPTIPATPGSTTEQDAGTTETPGQVTYGSRTVPGWSKPADVGPNGRPTPAVNYPAQQESVAVGETEGSGAYPRRSPIVTGSVVPTAEVPGTPGTPSSTRRATGDEALNSFIRIISEQDPRVADYLKAHGIGQLIESQMKEERATAREFKPFPVSVEGMGQMVFDPRTHQVTDPMTGKVVTDPAVVKAAFVDFQRQLAQAKELPKYERADPSNPAGVFHGGTFMPIPGRPDTGAMPLELAQGIEGKARANPQWAGENPEVVAHARGVLGVNVDQSKVKSWENALAQATAAAQVARTIPQEGKLDEYIHTNSGAPVEAGASLVELAARAKTGEIARVPSVDDRKMYAASVRAVKALDRMRGVIEKFATNKPFDQFITFKGGTIFGNDELANAIAGLQLQAATVADALVRTASGGVARNVVQVKAINALIGGKTEEFFKLVNNQAAMLGTVDTAKQMLTDQQVSIVKPSASRPTAAPGAEADFWAGSKILKTMPRGKL
jgi:hypothetical protein